MKMAHFFVEEPDALIFKIKLFYHFSESLQAQIYVLTQQFQLVNNKNKDSNDNKNSNNIHKKNRNCCDKQFCDFFGNSCKSRSDGNHNNNTNTNTNTFNDKTLCDICGHPCKNRTGVNIHKGKVHNKIEFPPFYY